MKVTVATTGWNESRTIVSVIRYYLNICKFDRFIYFDNFSTDDTLLKITQAFPEDDRVVIKETPYVGHMPVLEVDLINDTMIKDNHDVFFWIDSDEIIYCKDFQGHFKNLKSRKKYYSAMHMSNVFNESNTFNADLENIIDNFEYVTTDLENPVFKVPILIKHESLNSKFCGGHHTVNINGENIGNYPECKINVEDFFDKGIHLFHFTYIDEEMYYTRKTLGRLRNITLGIDNSWYSGYWNQSREEIKGLINNSKISSICTSISAYLL
jgi:hypothetical protein